MENLLSLVSIKVSHLGVWEYTEPQDQTMVLILAFAQQELALFKIKKCAEICPHSLLFEEKVPVFSNGSFPDSTEASHLQSTRLTSPSHLRHYPWKTRSNRFQEYLPFFAPSAHTCLWAWSLRGTNSTEH